MSSTLNDKLSQHWNCIQDNLFPWIEESLGPLSDKHRQLISVLEFADIDSHFSTYRGITELLSNLVYGALGGAPVI